MLTELATDWQQLQTDCTEKVLRWSEQIPALAGCGCLEDVLTAINAEPDSSLGGLLRVHQDGDQLAGRVIIQALLPGLLTSWRRDRRAELSDFIAQMWFVMARHDLQRRPRAIAANLLLDTRKAVRADHRPTRWVQLGEVGEPGTPAADLTAVEVISQAAALQLVDDITCQVLTSVYADGLTGQEAAIKHETSAEAIRWRCSKYLRRLAAHRDDLLAACA